VAHTTRFRCVGWGFRCVDLELLPVSRGGPFLAVLCEKWVFADTLPNLNQHSVEFSPRTKVRTLHQSEHHRITMRSPLTPGFGLSRKPKTSRCFQFSEIKIVRLLSISSCVQRLLR